MRFQAPLAAKVFQIGRQHRTVADRVKSTFAAHGRPAIDLELRPSSVEDQRWKTASHMHSTVVKSSRVSEQIVKLRRALLEGWWNLLEVPGCPTFELKHAGIEKYPNRERAIDSIRPTLVSMPRHDSGTSRLETTRCTSDELQKLHHMCEQYVELRSLCTEPQGDHGQTGLGGPQDGLHPRNDPPTCATAPRACAQRHDHKGPTSQSPTVARRQRTPT